MFPPGTFELTQVPLQGTLILPLTNANAHQLLQHTSLQRPSFSLSLTRALKL